MNLLFVGSELTGCIWRFTTNTNTSFTQMCSDIQWHISGKSTQTIIEDPKKEKGIEY